MRLTDLADYLRKHGLIVVEHEGWRQRGVPFPAKPDTVICHHTASSARAPGDLPTLRLLLEGRSDLPGPLCQIALARSGVVHLIAAGKANHAGKGAWRGQTSSAHTLGIEAEHPGGTAVWTARQYDAYVNLCAALCRYLEVDPDRVCGHREWALPVGRKVDVTFDLDTFRAKVRQRLGAATPTPAPDEDEMTPADWAKLTTLLDDRLRIILRAEKADGTATGHDNLRDVKRRLERIEAKLEAKS
jgi:hypothetical protein